MAESVIGLDRRLLIPFSIRRSIPLLVVVACLVTQVAIGPGKMLQQQRRYRSLKAADITEAVNRYLPKDRRVELSIVPENKQ